MKKTGILWVCIMLTAALAEAYELQDVRIHGFVSQGYLVSDANDFLFADTEDGTFEFNEMGINFSKNLSEGLYLGIQFLSRDLGKFGDNEVEIDWAFADYRYQNWLGLRAGKIKIPLGLYNQSRDIDAARTAILLPQSIYYDVYREASQAMTSVGLYGILPGGLEYQALYGTIDIDADGGIAQDLAETVGASVRSVDVQEDSYVVNLLWTSPLEGLRLGGTLTAHSWTMETGIGPVDFDWQAFVLSAEYSVAHLTLALEYAQAESDVHIHGFPPRNKSDEAYYGQLSYRFTPWLELGAYYSVYYEDKDDRDGAFFEKQGLPKAKGWLKDHALSLRFDITEHWIFKLEGHYMDGLARNVTFDPADPEDQWFLFGAKTTFSF